MADMWPVTLLCVGEEVKMTNPQVSRMFFRIAFYITLVSAVLLLALKPGSAEFVVAGITLFIGLVSIAVIALIVRRFSR
jgi:NADH:ubiquinone oxidoreductase subunit H